MPSDSEQRPLRSPEPSRGGPDIDAAVQNAESDTQTEGVHRSAPPGQAVGDSRLEQMREVDTSGERAEPAADLDTVVEQQRPPHGGRGRVSG